MANTVAQRVNNRVKPLLDAAASQFAAKGYRAAGKRPFVLDSPRPSIPLREYAYNEMRYKILTRTHPEEAEKLMQSAQELIELRWQTYEHMANQEPSKFQPAG